MQVNMKFEVNNTIYSEGSIISLKGMMDVPVEFQKASIISIENRFIKVHVFEGIAKRDEYTTDLEGRELEILFCNIETINLCK